MLLAEMLSIVGVFTVLPSMLWIVFFLWFGRLVGAKRTIQRTVNWFRKGDKGGNKTIIRAEDDQRTKAESLLTDDNGHVVFDGGGISSVHSRGEMVQCDIVEPSRAN